MYSMYDGMLTESMAIREHGYADEEAIVGESSSARCCVPEQVVSQC